MGESRSLRAPNRHRDGGATRRALTSAMGHRAAGRHDRAKAELARILGAIPGHPEAHYELGALANAAGDRGVAIQHLVAALRGAPERPAYWLALATSLLAQDRVAEARAILERFKAQDFESEAATAVLSAITEQAHTRALIHYDGGAFREAEALLDLVISLDDAHAEATYLAGAIAAQTNRLGLAFDLFSIAIYRDPTNANYFNSLGAALTTRGDHHGAISALEKAIALDPNLAAGYANLAGVHQRCFRHGTALQHAGRAIALNPGLSSAHSNRGSALMSIGRMRDAIASFDLAIQLDPSKQFIYSNRLFAKLYSGHVPPTEYLADAQAFGRLFADPVLRRRAFLNVRSADRCLRIGFVSGDLCNHALVRFFEAFISAFDRSRFETFAYMTHASEDAVSERLRPAFAGWHNISGLDDDEAADLVERDRIDVLVDLSGHSAGNRLMLFARKPAPVQVTWIGHPATTGLTAIDYRLTDAVTDPPGLTEPLHTERLWRLPRVSATYRGPQDIPEVRERAPCEDNGYVTFGCFNRFTKVSDETLATWGRILSAVDTARLFIVVADVEAPDVRSEVETRLVHAGLPLERVILQARVNGDYYRLYHGVDIALDPFPYNGGTTSYDTLRMGVPFVTLAGTHAAARTGVTVLSAVGLTELIAEDLDRYVEIARDLAGDRDRLRGMRDGLQRRLLSSALMDHRGVAEEVGDAFRAMWRVWLAERSVPPG